MRKRTAIGIAFIAAGAVLAGMVGSASGAPVEKLLGMASWYLPYLAVVAGVKWLAGARG